MSLYLATCEDGDGMWFTEPIAADGEAELRKLVEKQWPTLPAGITVVLYRCQYVDEIVRPRPPQAERKERNP